MMEKRSEEGRGGVGDRVEKSKGYITDMREKQLQQSM